MDSVKRRRWHFAKRSLYHWQQYKVVGDVATQAEMLTVFGETGLAAMNSGVTLRAQRNQVLLGVGPRVAAEFPMVHLEVRHRATGLTPPAVAAQYLLAQTFV